jgi:hydrogenase maturation protein HypF
MNRQGRRIEISGTVQGVGFRPWIYRLAHAEGIGGRVRNDAAGVVVEAFGPDAALDRFVQRIEAAPPVAAEIRTLQWRPIAAQESQSFEIDAATEADGEPDRTTDMAIRRISIPADLATCDACAQEISDETDRRYRYPFTNCTNCGPRFTIARGVPYDRPATTMADFPMCDACRREYEDPRDRRFHAQPNACPACGPRLRALLPNGAPHGEADALRAAARALEAGSIVALKGIGGFHLACDATSPAAVERLRARKQRDQKPFAVMVRDLAAAQQLARLDEAERRLLTSVERPIVLARRHRESGLAAAVAPENPLVGLLLPYTPLHHLLLGETDRPLVMTSGNLSDEPIAFSDREALARLADLADLFLVHDREIESRCDDSVARVVAGRPTVLRRARGYVPHPVALRRPFAAPTLGVGGHLKNTFCIGVGHDAYLGPHIGDLDNLKAVHAFEETVARMERLLDVRPRIVAHDLHPGYQSTDYALARHDTVVVGVQHHHAHVVSIMAEHGLAGPAIGIAYDGTGFGTDGTSWGGEILLVEAAAYERLATFRPIALPGGDLAMRQVWRAALGLFHDAFGETAPLDRIPLFRNLPAHDIAVVRRMIASGLNAPPARGVGRYFDAVGALVLGRAAAAYEGQVAMALNFAAATEEKSRYSFSVTSGGQPLEIDLRQTTRAVIGDLLDDVAPQRIAARFHNTVVAATERAVRDALRRTGRLPVILCGGCFQNDLLVSGLLSAMADQDVYLPRQVPAGDGGIALGQAVVANAMVRTGSSENSGERRCA